MRWAASVSTAMVLLLLTASEAFQPSPINRLPQASLRDDMQKRDHQRSGSRGNKVVDHRIPSQLWSVQDQNDGQNRKRLPGRGGGLIWSGSSNRLYKDVVIVGGGLAGLSVALSLSQIDPTRQITVLDSSDLLESPTGSFAAAGMLAPQSERLPKGDYLNLCMASKRMFPEFCQQVEQMARESGEEGAPYLASEDENSDLKPWNIGYVASGGFLAPAFAGDNVATWAPPEDSKGTAVWLDAMQARELEPNLHPDVVGGWWFPEDASVDARRLAGSLKAACIGAGVQFQCGKNYEVSSLDLEEGNCKGLWLKTGKYISANAVLVANGAWMRTLLPVPIEPHKGQSLSLRMPKDRPPILRRVLFAQDSYIVPKADGRIVIGATVEAGSFDGQVTPAGIMHILSYALELLPGLADLPLEETWAGLRPTTPDKAPILGETPWKNLFLAGGYWRNGVLLAPKTGELMASLIAGLPLSEEDQTYLKAFAWDRFTSQDGSTALSANSRYAASMYPIHRRKSGVGVAASVGTELGSYSTAASAGEERQKDRESLWADEGSDDAFERAASLGQRDAEAFSFGEKVDRTTEKPPPAIKPPDTSSLPHFLDIKETPSETKESTTRKTTPSPDALTVGFSETTARKETKSTNDKDLESIYEEIRKNKAKMEVEMEEGTGEERPDPGFRIFHVDKETGKQTEVPPYTSPGDFLESLQQQPKAAPPVASLSEDQEKPIGIPGDEEELTFDGYQRIKDAAAQDDDIRETMRKARIQNRAGEDDSPLLENLGVRFEDDNGVVNSNGQAKESSKPDQDLEELSVLYEKIRQQKAKATPTELSEPLGDDRPDPGFRIFHVDKETGEKREVPPYTSPGEFLESIGKEEDGSLAESQEDSREPKVHSVSFRDESADSDKWMDVKKEKNNSEQPQDYSETTYDGYQDIIQSNSANSREAELDAMREARRKNRMGGDEVDEDTLGL